MTAKDSQTPGRIPAPATRPRSGAEPRFGRVGIEFTSPNAGRGRRSGSRDVCAAGDPDPPGRRRSPLARQTSRAAGPFAALSLRSERLLGAGSLRRLANAVPARNPSTIAVRTSGPTCPRPGGPSSTSESTCVRHGRRPTSPPAGFYALHGMRKPSAPTRHAVAAATLATAVPRSTARRGVCSKEVSPFDWATSGTTGQPGLIATRTLPRISRFARRLEGRR